VLHVAQPGHWLGPVTGPGWLGPAQPRPCGLRWAQPKKTKKNKNKKNRKHRNKNFASLRKNVFLSIYSLISESGIKKKIMIFFVAMNFYQRQSSNYSWWNFY
jgi:hypothetical protein